MPDPITDAATLLDALDLAFDRAATYNERSRVAPAAILWTDAKEEWTRLLPRLRERFPQLLTLGAYDPDVKQGPAIWLKCMIARTLDAADWPEEDTPVLYLPGVSRRDIRAVESCPPELQPLAELQYRGTLWTQTNARDWTVRAFLVTEEGGLDLNVAGDEATREAMHRALPELAHTPLANLRGRHLDAEAFRSLITQDPVRDLLRWLSNPQEMEADWSPERWETFGEICRNRYDFDPEKDGPIPAAKRLGLREGAWARVWQRYLEAPDRYPGIADRLRQARPPQTGDLFGRESAWPQDNEALEEDLRASLAKLDGARPDRAAQQIVDLEEQHAERRTWVWAELGKSPLAEALRPLHDLAQAVQSPAGGATPEDVAVSYREGGWKADAAALKALETVRKRDDVEAVKVAVRTLYQPWLERGAEALQDAVAEHGVPEPPSSDHVQSGEVILFADALRYDVAQRLIERLQFNGFEVESAWQWSALPSVTATAKPAVSPVAKALSQASDVRSTDAFAPQIEETGDTLNIRRFRLLMEEQGHQILQGGETGDPSGTAWTEIGNIDRHGHDEEWKLARRIPELVREITERIRQLLDAGWSSVRIVTDHGWLLLPGDLPKEHLPHYLSETRWSRCARLKDEAQVSRQTVPWHWNPDVRIATGPGVSVHRNGIGYAHGGLSVQECVVPRLTVRSDAENGSSPEIERVEWTRLRCRIQVRNPSSGLKVDLRRRAGDAGTSIAFKPKAVSEDGSASLAVDDPSNEGTSVTVVLLDGEEVVHTYSTEVGAS